VKTRRLGEGNKWGFFPEKGALIAHRVLNGSLISQFGFARLFLRKTGGLPWMSVKEQELSDLTASILATFPRISNIFLHFRQVVDSTPQKGRSR